MMMMMMTTVRIHIVLEPWKRRGESARGFSPVEIGRCRGLKAAEILARWEDLFVSHSLARRRRRAGRQRMDRGISVSSFFPWREARAPVCGRRSRRNCTSPHRRNHQPSRRVLQTHSSNAVLRALSSPSSPHLHLRPSGPIGRRGIPACQSRSWGSARTPR